MKKATLSVCLLALSVSTIASANVRINKDAPAYGEIALIITGDDARIISEVISERSSLEKKADQKDLSNIRAVSCGLNDCTIIVDGESKTNKDTEDYYSKSYNKQLLALKDSERLVSAPTLGKGYDGGTNTYDAKVLRAILDNNQSLNAKITRYSTSKIGKGGDSGVVPLFKIEWKLSSLNITCYSTLYTDMGDVNRVHESCSISAVGSL